MTEKKQDINEIQKFVKDLNDENSIFGFQIFKKPDNLQTILISMKYLTLRCILVCKKKWQQLVKNATDENLGKKRLLYVFFIGLCNCVATTPFSLIAILPLTFGSLLFILDKEKKSSLKTQLLTIFSFLFGHFVSIFWWFFVPLTVDFLHFFWLTPFAIFGLPAVITCCFMPFFAIFLKLWNKVFIQKTLFQKFINSKYIKNVDNFAEISYFVLFLICWFCGDFVRGHIIFGGFPWMLFGHFIHYSFAMQAVKLLGIDLYSIFTLSLCLSIYYLIFKRKNKILQNISLSIIGLWILNCIVGLLIVIITPKPKFNANIIAPQINYPATLDFEKDSLKIINNNIKLISWSSKSAKDTIILFPESSINFPLTSRNSIAKQIGHVVPNDRSLLVAGGLYVEDDKIYNAIYALNDDGQIVDLYKKQNLVPFGEYIPFRKFLPNVVSTITGGMLDFNTDGANDLFIFHRDLPIMYPTICYESIFPRYVKKNIKKSRKKIAKLTKEYIEENNIKSLKDRKEVILNLTNDAWMKWSVAPYQHFLMARFLAVSANLPVIRVSNNGISAIINKNGKVYNKTSLNKEDIIVALSNV